MLQASLLFQAELASETVCLGEKPLFSDIGEVRELFEVQTSYQARWDVRYVSWRSGCFWCSAHERLQRRAFRRWQILRGMNSDADVSLLRAAGLKEEGEVERRDHFIAVLLGSYRRRDWTHDKDNDVQKAWTRTEHRHLLLFLDVHTSEIIKVKTLRTSALLLLSLSSILTWKTDHARRTSLRLGRDQTRIHVGCLNCTLSVSCCGASHWRTCCFLAATLLCWAPRFFRGSGAGGARKISQVTSTVRTNHVAHETRGGTESTWRLHLTSLEPERET